MTPPYGPALRQPDQTSCGAACVVVAGLLRSPAAAPTAASFAHDVLDTHRRLVQPVDAVGRAQVPWPPALGTPPWAVAKALQDIEGVPYRTRVARWSASSAYAIVVTAVATHPVALYIGSSLMPRHVVLAVSAGSAGLSVYDPASGGLVTVTQEAFVGSSLRIAGWNVPWFVVAGP
ncbi:hypothetical protein GCM10009798_27140 [Nocardioides panacihumi]|uniref:Peptidase C39-like domain-containing protein n=1 Tax=Nocardioides panacihumi TaxID=400774 RepID=A0ABP5CKL9_9ACTN